MIKYLILIYFILISCNQSKTVNTTLYKTDKNKIVFDYTISKTTRKNSLTKFDITLSNYNKDTVYFLSMSCDGLGYNLNYDTAKMTLFPHFYCNVSYLIIQKIPPNGVLKFDANFIIRTNDKKIALSFNMRKVDKDYDVNTDSKGNTKNPEKIETIILKAEDHYFE